MADEGAPRHWRCQFRAILVTGFSIIPARPRKDCSGRLRRVGATSLVRGRRWPTNWSTEQDRRLIKLRGISFESVVSAIEQGGLADVLEHSNQDRCPGQMIYLVEVKEHRALREEDCRRWLLDDDDSQLEGDENVAEKSAIVNDDLRTEERGSLDRLEPGDLRAAGTA